MARPDITLSLQRALLGEVSAALRGVAVVQDDHRVRLRFYYDGLISEEDQDSASCVATELVADLPPEYEVGTQLLRIDPPGRLPNEELWVYRRREND